jgi:putative transposase
MPFWKCYYHLIWATKHRAPLITPQHERVIYETVRNVSEELGSMVIAINGVADHVHVAATIPPSVAVSEWFKRCKGASSYAVNQSFAKDEPFRWQGGFGALTFGQQRLAMVVRYIENQKEHHATGKLRNFLERLE